MTTPRQRAYTVIMAKKHTFLRNERSDYSDVNCHFWHGEKPPGHVSNRYFGDIAEHSHSDYYEVVIATSGVHHHIISGLTVTLKRGDVLVISPAVAHSILSGQNAEHFNVAVKSSFFERMTANKSAVKELISRFGYFTAALSDNAISFVGECISKMDNANFGALSYTLAETILSIVFLAVINADDEPKSGAAYYCYDAITKIENGALVDKSAAEIYALYPVSHTAFISEFKRITGKPLSEYLTEQKLHFAKKLLSTTSLSVLDVAGELGFDSVSHFIKIFKGQFGITPLRYRKNK